MLSMRNKDVLSSLPLLASVLGDKYGVEVRIGGDQAATNGKVIFIPSLPLDADDNLLALVRGYIDHESGHIRFTDHDAMLAARMDTVTQFLWNCIEDWRIENRLAEMYPGCKQNLHWLLRRLFLKEQCKDDERAGDNSPALSVLKFVLLTVRMWDLPEISPIQQKVKGEAEACFAGITSELEKILNRVRLYCPDTKTAIAYAQEMADCIRHWKPVQAENERSCKDDQQDGDEQSCKQGCSEPSSETHIKDGGSDGGQANGQNADEGSSSSDSKPKAQAAESLSDLFKITEDALPATTGKILQNEIQLRRKNDEHECLAVAHEETVVLRSLTVEDQQHALRASNALKVRLHGLLQATVRKPAYLGRSGKLYSHSLYRLQTANTSVFLKQEERRGISTAVHILLDASGSMMGKQMHLASLACYAVAKALEGIQGISVGVSIFPASSESHNVGQIVRHGERVSDRFAVVAQGTTPLAEALWWTLQALVRLKEHRKIVLILTDGYPNNLQATEQAIQTSLKCGIEVYGIGIQNSSIEKLLAGRCEVISTLDNLAPAMFKMLQQSLIGGSNGRRN